MLFACRSFAFDSLHIALCLPLFAYRSLIITLCLSVSACRSLLIGICLSLFAYRSLLIAFAYLSLLTSVCLSCRSSPVALWLSRLACGTETARGWSWTVPATSPPPQTASNGPQVRPAFSNYNSQWPVKVASISTPYQYEGNQQPVSSTQQTGVYVLLMEPFFNTKSNPSPCRFCIPERYSQVLWSQTTRQRYTGTSHIQESSHELPHVLDTKTITIRKPDKLQTYYRK